MRCGPMHGASRRLYGVAGKAFDGTCIAIVWWGYPAVANAQHETTEIDGLIHYDLGGHR